MLQATFYLDDDLSIFERIGSRVNFSRNSIDLFVSPNLQASCQIRENVHEIWIGESEDPFTQDPRSATRAEMYRSFRKCEGVKIFASLVDSKANYRIVRTETGGSPLYLSHSEGRLVLSWRFEDAVKNLSSAKPDAAACRLYLDRGPALVRDMIIAGVYMLWPGEISDYSVSGLKFSQASVPEIVLTSTLTDTARATDAFLSVISTALKQSLGRADHCVVELSGGYDSACAAFGATALSSKISSYGLIHPGVMGKQQKVRRNELLQLLQFKDFEYPSENHTPLLSLKEEESSLTPFDDNHRLPCVRALDEHPDGPFDAIITGIGGDELTMENTFYREPWEIQGGVCSSAVVSSVARADMFMRRGIWPCNPLSHPDVVDFCRALPKALRTGRMLNILTLARAGLSDGYLFPRYSEHYGIGSNREVAYIDFHQELETSILADYKIYLPNKLLGKTEVATYHGFDKELLSILWRVLKLEAVLKRYV